MTTHIYTRCGCCIIAGRKTPLPKTYVCCVCLNALVNKESSHLNGAQHYTVWSMRDSAGPYRLANTVFILKMAVGRLVIQMTNLVRTSLLVLQKGHHGNPTGCTPPAPPPSPSHHHTPSPSCQRGTPPPAPLMANSHPPDEHRPPVLAYVHLKRETTTGQQRSNQTI